MTFLCSCVVMLAGATSQVVATVDGTAITSGSVTRRVQASRGQPRPPAPGYVLDGLIDEALLAAEARRHGLERSSDVAQRIDAEKRRAAAEALLDREAARHEPDERLLREMFHSTSDFVSFESLTFEKRETAQAALERIRKGATLASEARNAVTSQLYPDPRSAPPMMRAQLDPALADVLFSAAPGTMVGPVQGEIGIVIARPIRKEIGTNAAFAAGRATLLQRAQKRIIAAVRERFLETLREEKRGSVKIDEPFLRGLGGAAPTQEQLDHAVAVVNGRQVRYREVYDSMRTLGAASGHGAGPTIRLQLVRRLIDELMLQDLAIERGLDKAPEVAARLEEIEREALAQAAIARIRSAARPPSEREIEDTYKRNAARFARPFREVFPLVARQALADKQNAALGARVRELRKKASISIDRAALARAAKQGA